MIVAYAKDGVMLATESRGNFYDIKDKNKEPIAFFDGVPKISLIKNIAIASTGSGTIGDITMENLFNQFEKVLNFTPPVSTVLNSFFMFSRRIMDDNLFSQLCSNKIIAVGRENNKVVISLFQNNQFGTLLDGHICSDKCDFSNHYNASLTCKDLGKIAEKSIYAYAKLKNMESTIGGDVSVLKITENSFEWLQNKPVYKYNFVNEIVNDCKIGKIKYKLTNPSNQVLLDQLFDSIT